MNLRHLVDNINPFDGQSTAPQKAPPARLPQQGQPGFGVVRPGATVMRQPAPRPKIDTSIRSSVMPALKQVGTGVALGALRVGTGIAQDTSGLADIAGQKLLHRAPAGATSRVDKGLDSFAKSLDQTNNEQVHGAAKAAYHITQGAGTAATFLAPSAIAKGVASVPKVASAIERTAPATNLISRAVAPTTKLVSNVGGKIMPGTDAVGRVAGAVVKGGLSKTNMLNAAGGTVAMAGNEASHGQDVNRGTVARDFGTNVAFGAGLSGAGQVAREAIPGIQAAGRGVNSAYKAGANKQRVNGNIEATQAQLNKEHQALLKQVQNTPVENTVANNNLQAKIDRNRFQHQALEAQKQKLSVPEKVLTAQPGLSMKPTGNAPATTPKKQLSGGAKATPAQPASKLSQSESGVSSLKNTPKMSIPEDAPTSGFRQRGLASTIMDDPNTPAEVKAGIGELYKVRNTKDLQSRAANLVKDDPALAMRVFKSDSNSDVGTMIGGELSAHLSRTGQHDAALEIAQQMSREATHRGQANQALSTWGKLAPESILRFAQTTVNQYNKRAGLIGGSKELKLTPETAKKLTGMSEDLQKMAPGHDKDIATQKMLNEVKELVPSSWVRKVGTLQTIGQLLNPKTLIRNIGGNTMFAGLENTSQTLAAGIDKTLSAVRGTPREVALPSLKRQAQGALKGGKQQFEETTKGVNLGPDTQYDLGDTQTFTKGFLGGVEKTMGIALRVPDRAALTAAVDDTVAGLMKANKLEQPTQEILDEAAATGLYRTFQDNSKAAQLFTDLKGALNKGVGFTGKDGKRFGLGDLILKYPKTPGNILARGIDYSPAGIVKGLYEIAKPAISGQPFNQRAFSMAVSRGVVGSSALMGTGAVLGALGIITEKPSQDTDTRNLQKASGQGGYQINTTALRRFIRSGLDKSQADLRPGDTLVSYDWAQPASIPLSAGAALGKGKSGIDGAVSTLDNAASGFNSLVEQPLVTGVNTFATNIKNYGLTGAFGKAVQGAPASFVPTLSNQLRQLTDNNTRNTYDPSGTQTAVNMVKNKIPGLDTSLPNKVGPLGENLQNYQNGSNNLFNVAFNPAFVNKYQPNADAKLPLDILNNSGNTSQIPTTVKTSQNINGTNRKLTAAENHDLQQFVGTTTKQAIAERRNDPAFMALPDDLKAKEIAGIISDIQAAGRSKLLGDAPAKTQLKAVDRILTGNLTYSPKKTTTSSTTTKKTSSKTTAKSTSRKVASKGTGSRKGKSRATLASMLKLYGNSSKSPLAYEKTLRSLVQQAHLSKAKA